MLQISDGKLLELGLHTCTPLDEKMKRERTCQFFFSGFLRGMR